MQSIILRYDQPPPLISAVCMSTYIIHYYYCHSICLTCPTLHTCNKWDNNIRAFTILVNKISCHLTMKTPYILSTFSPTIILIMICHYLTLYNKSGTMEVVVGLCILNLLLLVFCIPKSWKTLTILCFQSNRSLCQHQLNTISSSLSTNLKT